MKQPLLRTFTRLLVLSIALFLVFDHASAQSQHQEKSPPPASPQSGTHAKAQADAKVPPHPAGCVAGRMRCITAADRRAAAIRAKKARAGKSVPAAATPGGMPNYFGPESNWANSPIIPKFVDSLPGLTSAHANNLGNFIPVAKADTTTYPNSDFYHIQLNDYQQKMHSSLPATLLRGYQDVNADPSEAGNHYLGPLIIAQKDRPVRVLFDNKLGLGTAGNLFIPVDTTLMGAGAPYTQNRATLHLHGGNTPWISDGTPHQWITPGDNPQKGDSQQNVPDMAVPPLGSATFIWPNTQQSGRLEFYHDHALGTTRLNVYSGEAAGYLIVDPTEDSLISGGVLPNQGGGVYNYGIPLIIQDKSFVDPVTTLQTDPTWPFGPVAGNLWFPHVYVPNQNPADPEGVNAIGRWDYGPWFWPPQDPSTFVQGGQPVPCPTTAFPTQICPGTPNPSLTPEAFMDTPLVNGQAYPYLTVEPKAYRFRILSAGNDRSLNLQLYYAADTATGPGTPGKPGTVCKGTGSPSTCTEVNMVTAAPPSGTPPLCTTATQIGKSGLALGDLTLSPSGLPANCWPTTWPTDGRDGGVPDPSTAGPAIIQIGTEGGMLPAPVVIPSTPVGYEYNRKSIVVLNVANHGLLIGPAERADVIIDFSSVPSGSSLILYNDSPAPIPAFDPRLDYYTGDPDQLADGTGGAPSTAPGFGPNTRTIMQFRVQGAPGTPYSVPALSTALSAAYAGIQPQPVVPETAYKSNFPTPPYNTDNYVRIQDNTITFTPATPGLPYAGAPCSPAPPAGQACAHLLPKAIQELFTLDYGRMNATLGIELPFTRFQNQTTIPYGYVDPPTEFITEGQPQIWKITHNGVDTHFIHFHLFNVQVINRVGWDGQIRAPDANEVGWKDTVRMSPLEDIVVALQAIAPQVPFAMPTSNRLYDVTMPAGMTGPQTNPNGGPYFANQDPQGNATTTQNLLTNFGWEYVWHCHILGHEENDMMRPIVFTPKAAMITPTSGSAILATAPTTFTWNASPPVSTSFGGVTTNYGVASSYLWLGSAAGLSDYYAGTPGTGTTTNVDISGKPIPNGSTAYARLFSTVNGVTLSNDYTYIVGNPLAGVAPLSVPFGNQLVQATSLSQLVTVTSGGLAPLTVSGATITGSNPGDFALGNGCTLVPTGTNCTISVTFTPTATGGRSATLNINSNDPVNPLITVALTGTGVVPVAGVSPTTLTFAPLQKLNTTSAPQAVTLSNTGTAPLGITSIMLTGVNASEFAIQSNACGTSLAFSSNCAINVTFKPLTNGLKSAALTIISNDPASPTINVAITGMGPLTPVGGSVSPASGGGTSQMFTATFTDANGGTDITDARLLINSTLSSSNACYVRFSGGRFYLMNDAGTTFVGGIVPGSGSVSNSQCTLSGAGSSYTASAYPGTGATLLANVTFTLPGFAGIKSIWLYSIDSTNLNSGLVLKGSWSVGNVAPVAGISPTSLNFPSPAQTATLSNTGSGPLTINSIGITGTNAGDFAISSNICGATLAAGSTCAISIAFTASSGPRSASLTISTNDAVNPTLNVVLNGIGALAPVAGTVSPPSGSGSTGVFTATYTDGNGGTDITDARILINRILSSANSCYVRYSGGRFYLMNDAGTAFVGGIVSGSGSVSNSQCTLLGAGSSYNAATYPGTAATLTVNLQFTLPGFAGSKNVYLYAIDTTNKNTGLPLKGTWTVQ